MVDPSSFNHKLHFKRKLEDTDIAKIAPIPKTYYSSLAQYVSAPNTNPRNLNSFVDSSSQGGANPNGKDRCGNGMKATINDPKYRTLNRNATAGSAADWTRFNPWRAPGNAPVYDPCGRAGGAAHGTPGHGEFTNTTYAKFGDLGSQLPRYPTGTVWAAGSDVETMQSIRANHVWSGPSIPRL